MDIALIRPTGTCFDDALDFISAMLRGSTGDAKLRWIESLILVHGICIAPDGRQYAHAWVEHLEQVWQAGFVKAFGIDTTTGRLSAQRAFYATPHEKFYKDLAVLETTRYTVREAMQMNERHDNFGPWEERYRALCGQRH